MASYRIIALSVTHPGDLLVQDDDGTCRVYFGARDSLSLTTMDPSLVEALAQTVEWGRASTDAWLSLGELRAHAAGLMSESLSTGRNPSPR